MTSSPSSPKSVALVTGATGGLGRAFAEHLLDGGYELVLSARDHDRLGSLAQELGATRDTKIDVLPADLSTRPGRDAVCARLADRVDLLVNNAGFFVMGPVWELDPAVARAQLKVTVNAPMELTHAALPAMIAHGSGAIINVSSISGVLSGPASLYTAGKVWMVRFTEGLANQLDGTGVRVQVLCPGYMRTEFHTRAGQGVEDIPDALWLEPADVVRHSMSDLDRARTVSIPGSRYRVMATRDSIKPRLFR